VPAVLLGLAIALLGPAPLARAVVPDWPTIGGDPGRSSVARGSAIRPGRARLVLGWQRRLPGKVTAAPIVLGRERLAIVGTNDGALVALRLGSGAVAWRRQLGVIANGCAQIPPDRGAGGRFGVVGAPALDPRNRLVYAADAGGALHAVAGATGVEQPGWPVQLIADSAHELVWGGLTLANGRVYATSGSYCDATPYTGRIYGVDRATRAVTSFTPVPTAAGNGSGGVWGWGGVAIDPTFGDVWAATGNANPLLGPEDAGAAERIIRLSPDLATLRGAAHPSAPPRAVDADFGATPTLFRPRGCPPLVAAPSKVGRLYVYDRRRLGGPPVAAPDLGLRDVLVGMATWDPRSGRLLLDTKTGLRAFAFGPHCRLRAAWRTRRGEIGPVAVANGVVVRMALAAGGWALELRRARDGRRLWHRGLPAGIAEPAVAGDRVVTASYDGAISGWP
jgi:hypothetical protein